MMGEDTYISSTSVQPDIDIFMRQDAIIWQFTRTDLPHHMVLLRISEEQLLFNPARPNGFSWKMNLVPKLILSVTMQTIIKSQLVTILHAIGGGGVMQGDKIHRCRRVTANEVKGCWNHGYFSEMMHNHMMRQPCVSKVCLLGILMSSSGGSSEWYM